MTAIDQAGAVPEVDRNLAFLTYALLFFSIFFAGVPALIAVAIAYARRKDADPFVRGHHSFQIWIFWVGFTLALFAGAAGLSAVMLAAGEAIRQASAENWQGWRALRVADIVGPLTLTFGALFVVLGVCAAVWLATTSLYGFVRLASLRPMRQTRR